MKFHRSSVAIASLFLLVVSCQMQPTPSPTGTEQPVSYPLPAAPMDMELTGPASGYATLGDGRIISFERTSNAFEWEEVASGMTWARGLAVDDTAVYVVDMGELSCEPLYPSCPKVTPFDEVDIIKSSNARVLSYPIERDGLGEPRVLVDEIPVVGRDHAPNDLEFGPDGALYLAIGHVDFSWEHLELLEHPNLDWLGTVLRIDPMTGEPEVMSRGLRNVYGLAWTDDGRLIAVDNDGPTYTGWREEELLEIVEGGQYGYPDEGSLGPFDVRTAFPIYFLDSVGSAGITAYDQGVIVGSCGRVHYVPSLARSGYQRFEVHGVATIDGCATSVVVTENEMLVGVFGAEGSVLALPKPSAP